MTEADRDIMKEEIKLAIKETVNGKIDALKLLVETHNTKHEADMQEIKPFLQGAAGLGLLWKLFISVAGLIVAYTTIKGFLWK